MPPMRTTSCGSRPPVRHCGGHPRCEVQRASLRACTLAFLVALGVAVSARAQLTELFSQYVRVFRPEGAFAGLLVKVTPAAGDRWQVAEGGGVRLRVPADARVEVKPEGSRVLQVLFRRADAPRATVLRVDRYQPGPDDATEVDADYAAELVREYPARAFAGKFTVSDSGHLILGKKWHFALVGGEYQEAGRGVQRMQWTYLASDRQYFLTFDCPVEEWGDRQETLARLFLCFERTKGEK